MPESLTRRESAYVNLWGVRLHVGMASGFSSERCPASPRNRVRLQVGIASGIASEYLAGISRNLHTSSSRHARRFAPRFDSFAVTCGQAKLHEARDGLVERIGMLTGRGEHHAALERCNDLKGPRFRIRSADPLG